MIQDLGELTGPVLIFGGPYSNAEATLAIQEEARRLSIPSDRVICTGDVVAYCANPEETTTIIREWGIPVVMGNCEESIAQQAPDCGCGFTEGSSCSLLSISWYAFANQHISNTNRRWMQTLPSAIDFSMNGLSFRTVHGSTTQINEFVFKSTASHIKEEQLTATGKDVVIGGHCGLPFGDSLAHGYWLNAGVIGMPANDGTTQCWYLVLTPDHIGVHAQWHRLAYPYRKTQTAMRDCLLTEGYCDALSSGLWPSMDVLPDYEKSQQGTPLQIEPLFIERH
ncbi:metallophosphoesterase family protein [Neptunomonas phycophila]|uniref:metallophosphoesterase family protein n=1 Tax=Neptunomonas phycophila TaxID=1572645 RepID=UPI001BEC9213|nr:metallophosphoesterase family protein [Neptunomonas phycophila]MBT3146731.1 metallophosphoesterase [Neptunomonas phycophila]